MISEELKEYEAYMKKIDSRYAGMELQIINGKARWARIKQERKKKIRKERKPVIKNERKISNKSYRQSRVYKQERLKALKRDNYTCCMCGKTDNLHVHHMLGIACGGSFMVDNLVTLCSSCHTKQHKGEKVYNLMIRKVAVT